MIHYTPEGCRQQPGLNFSFTRSYFRIIWISISLHKTIQAKGWYFRFRWICGQDFSPMIFFHKINYDLLEEYIWDRQRGELKSRT